MKASVVVTGVSTGIGWSITQVLLEKGYHVFGSVRRQSDADRLQKEFGAEFTPLLMGRDRSRSGRALRGAGRRPRLEMRHLQDW